MNTLSFYKVCRDGALV